MEPVCANWCEALYRSGLRRLNISLDALDPARYRAITHGDVTPVLEGISSRKTAWVLPRSS